MHVGPDLQARPRPVPDARLGKLPGEPVGHARSNPHGIELNPAMLLGWQDCRPMGLNAARFPVVEHLDTAAVVGHGQVVPLIVVVARREGEILGRQDAHPHGESIVAQLDEPFLVVVVELRQRHLVLGRRRLEPDFGRDFGQARQMGRVVDGHARIGSVELEPALRAVPQQGRRHAAEHGQPSDHEPASRQPNPIIA